MIADCGQGVLHVVAREPAEIAALQEPVETIEKVRELGLARLLVEIFEALRIGVGIERCVGGFQIFKVGVILEVERGIEQLAKAAKGMLVDGGKARLLAQAVDELGLAQGNEMLERRAGGGCRLIERVGYHFQRRGAHGDLPKRRGESTEEALLSFFDSFRSAATGSDTWAAC